MLNIIKEKYYIEKVFIVLFGLYFFSLPIAGITAVQNIFLGLFIILFFVFNYNKIEYKSILEYKKLLFIFGSILLLALVSLAFTPEVKESLKEIRSELVKNFIFMVIFFYFTIKYFTIVKKYLLYVLAAIFLIHTCINIYMMIDGGGFGFRAGGLLDNGGGERFGIWATYSLAFSISLFFTKYKKLAWFFLILSVISIFANHTRATYLSMGVIFVVSAFYIFKYKYIKLLALLALVSIAIFMYIQSDYVSKRYDVKNTLLNLEHFISHSPSEYGKLEQDVDAGITARLAMWKSVIVYRIQDPFIPQGYGRFLYGKGIQENFKDHPENIPHRLFPQAHNDYISILYGLGLFGLVFFIWLFVYKIQIGFKTFKIEDTYYKFYSVFVILGTIGFMGSMMFGSFFGDSEAKFFYPLFGILLGSHYMIRNNTKGLNENQIN